MFEKSNQDPNGNIQTYTRNGFGATQTMDNLTYHYQAGTNKLGYIGDAVASGNYANDLDNQSSGNYTYDSIGNLLTDQQAGITSNITWSVYGKLLTISSKSLSYQYDASGNRIGKTVSGTNTWYVRDAQGNVLSTYSGSTMALQEQDLYGSSRLGLNSNAATLSGSTQYLDHLGTGSLFTFTRGKKLFELSNHLGNVLATVSDKKFGTPVSGIPSQISFYTADVKTAQDYYPFGMEMPGRQFNSTTYTYSFNGKRDDKDAEYGWQNYGMREYDRRRAQFISVDPITTKYPMLTPYQISSNNPIRNIDLDGLEGWELSSPKNNLKRDAEYYLAKLNNRFLPLPPSHPQATLSETNPTKMREAEEYTENLAIMNRVYNSDASFSIQIFNGVGAAANAYYPEVALSISGAQNFSQSNYNQGLIDIGSAIILKSLRIRADFGNTPTANNITTKLINSDLVNKTFTDRGLYKPYQSGVTLGEFDVSKDITNLVRLSGPKNIKGDWFTTAKEVAGLSGAELKNKFSLKYEPTQITSVTIKQGSSIRVGTASDINAFGTNGGGFQIEVLKGDVQYGESAPVKK